LEKEQKEGSTRAKERENKRARESTRERKKEKQRESNRASEPASARREEKPAAGAGARVPVPAYPRREGTRDPPRGRMKNGLNRKKRKKHEYSWMNKGRCHGLRIWVVRAKSNLRKTKKRGVFFFVLVVVFLKIIILYYFKFKFFFFFSFLSSLANH
jgi:hypothetical protein